MWYRYIIGVILIFTIYFLLYYFQVHSSFATNLLFYSFSKKDQTSRHTAIILAKTPSVRVLKHLNALIHVGVNAFVMCDEQPSKYTNETNRLLYVNDESLAQYGLTRNRVWDRVFVWLYHQISIDYVWLMEDDLTWTNVHHMVDLFDKYANSSADLLSRNIIYRNPGTLGWMWWPKVFLKILPENKWSGSLNMLSRVSRRLINAHQYYVQQLLSERKKLNLTQFDNNYYYQEFLIPTVGHMFNLTMLIYDHSKMDVFFLALTENNIRDSLANGKRIFHAVKHDSPLLINATVIKKK
ncbi:unnamed protein product [Adineta steineri]|uniref:Uncharacterized protein n=1 Tax=Adineta steineri TaxID=433720 RepID=A0A813WDC0_9BILA|nr:unnamed protein product [Adineta steineri]CAF0952268.1 unnamed protein product [Adineta steineri]CAF3526392.1 unnamed protein product [Adineta steineri]